MYTWPTGCKIATRRYWCHSNMDINMAMNFNISKCSLIHFTQATSHKKKTMYYLYDISILSSDHFKYLGVILQSNLTYDRHIQDITAKANRTPGLLWRNVKTSSLQLKEHAYKALVLPKLEYTSTVWSPWQRYLVDAIEKVQCRSTHYIRNDYQPDSSLSTMIKKLHSDSLEAKLDELSIAWLCFINSLIT